MIVPKLTEEQRQYLEEMTGYTESLEPCETRDLAAALARLDALEKVYDAAVELNGWGRLEPPDFIHWRWKNGGSEGERYDADYQNFLEALNLGGQP